MARRANRGDRAELDHRGPAEHPDDRAHPRRRRDRRRPRARRRRRRPERVRLREPARMRRRGGAREPRREPEPDDHRPRRARDEPHAGRGGRRAGGDAGRHCRPSPPEPLPVAPESWPPSQDRGTIGWRRGGGGDRPALDRRGSFDGTGRTARDRGGDRVDGGRAVHPPTGRGSGRAAVGALGDSYISGEAGRWAGNTNESSIAASTRSARRPTTTTPPAPPNDRAAATARSRPRSTSAAASAA